MDKKKSIFEESIDQLYAEHTKFLKGRRKASDISTLNVTVKTVDQIIRATNTEDRVGVHVGKPDVPYTMRAVA